MRIFVAVLVLSLVVNCRPDNTGNGAVGTQTTSSTTRTLPYDRAFNTLAQQGAFNGSVLVALPDTVFEQSYRMAGAPEPMHVSSSWRYPIAELNQLLLRAAYFRLADQGRINLNGAIGTASPVSISDADFGGDQTAVINYRMLLDHRAGLPERLVGSAITRLVSQPGIEEHYSPLGFDLLARMLAERLGTSVSEAIRVLVLEPAQMSNTGVLTAGAPPPVLAKAYTDAPGTLTQLSLKQVLDTASALPEYYSTITDLFYLAQWMPASAYLRGELRQPGVRPGYRAYFDAQEDGSKTVVVLSNFGGTDLSEVRRIVSK